MEQSAKRIYTEINKVYIENRKNPNLTKFIVDKTPFNGDDSDAPPEIIREGTEQYFVIIARVLPTSNIYNRSAYVVKLKVPVAYPFKPPKVEMTTPIYHPNIGPEGKICIPMLQLDDNWKPTNTLSDVIDAVIKVIDVPNIDEAVSSGIANEYLQNRAEHDRKVAEKVAQNMVSRQ